MIRKLTLLAMTALLVSGCEVKPTEFAYGSDACHYCKMTIVDSQHASQIVTVKGRPFKYDAIECMMNHLNKWDEAEPNMYLITAYDDPGKLVDATRAYYLVSDAIPSPMGEFLSGFESEETRDRFQKELGGKAYDWESLREEFMTN